MRTVLFLLLWAFVPTALLAQMVGHLSLDSLDAYVERARQQWQIPGMAIAVVKDGKVLHAKGYGLRDVESKRPVTANSLFAIASNSKAFTAAALAKLVAEGKLDWNDPLRKYLPWFELYDPWVSNNITVRDALCHNSGLRTFGGDLLWYETTYSTQEVLRRTRYLKPSFGFRAGYGYQNLLFSAAAEIIPVVTGMSWADYVTKHFLQPLEMKHTNTSVKDLAKAPDVALPHHVPDNGPAVVIPYLSWDNAPGAAALNSSVADMANWMLMQLANGSYNGQQLVEAKQLDYLRTMHNVNTVPQSARHKMNFRGYGLGWELYDYYGLKVIGHGGGSDGMISKVLMVPSENLGVVVLTNSINYLPSALAYWVLDAYLGKNPEDYSADYLARFRSNKATEQRNYEQAKANRRADSKPSLPLSELAGTYQSDLYGDVQVKLEGEALVVYFVPAPRIVGDLTHWEHNSFEIKLRHTPLLPHGRVNFVLGMDGKPEQLRISIPNPDFHFEELELWRKK